MIPLLSEVVDDCIFQNPNLHLLALLVLQASFSKERHRMPGKCYPTDSDLVSESTFL